MEKVVGTRQRRHPHDDMPLYKERDSSALANRSSSSTHHVNTSNYCQSQRTCLLTIVVLVVAAVRLSSTPFLPIAASSVRNSTNINNQTHRKDYPLKSLNIASSAEESFQRGFWQRAQPFPLNSFYSNVTCQVPMSSTTLRNEWQRRAPYVLLVGTQKGGTTAMAYYLYNHPKITYLPSKELHFFDEDMDHFPFQTDLNGSEILEAYQQNAVAKEYSLERLQTNLEAHILDATPNYLFASDRVPQRVLCACGPWVKLLILLRNPIDRAWSQYYMQVHHDLSASSTSTIGDRPHILSFEEYIDLDLKVLHETGVLPKDGVSLHDHAGSPQEFRAWQTYTRLGINSPLGRGLYSIQLRHWLEAMKEFEKPMSDLLILQTERMREDSQTVYQQVLKFLELPTHDLPNYDRIHETKYPPQTAMKPETRMRLQEFYRPYNRHLKDLLGSEWDGVWESG